MAHHETWIYHPTEPARVVTLDVSSGAPEGWSFDPSVIVDEAARSADAVSGIRPPVVDEASEADQPPDAFEGALKSASKRIADLEAIIESGMAANEKMATDLAASEAEIDEAAAEVLQAKERAEAAEARAEQHAATITALQAELATAREEPARLAAVHAAHDAERDALLEKLQGEVERSRAKHARR